MASGNLVGSSVVFFPDATNSVNLWFLLHATCTGKAGCGGSAIPYFYFFWNLQFFYLDVCSQNLVLLVFTFRADVFSHFF